MVSSKPQQPHTKWIKAISFIYKQVQEKKLREGGEEGSGYYEVSKTEVEATFQPQKDKETKEVYFCLFLPISHVIDSLLISQRSLKQ